MKDDLWLYNMLPQIICRYTTFFSDITKSSKKIYFNVCDLEKMEFCM